MCVLPHQQQLHAEFNGLHGLPPGGLEQHAVLRWERAESHYGGLPVNGVRLLLLPPNHQVGRRQVRPQRVWFPVDEFARSCGQRRKSAILRVLPYQQQLQPCDCADGLRQLRLPLDDMAADEQSSAPIGGGTFRGGQLLYMPQHDLVDYCDVRSQCDGFPADKLTSTGAGGESRGLHGLPHQQQLHFNHNAYRLWKLAMPLDDLAADQQPSTPERWSTLCGDELLDMP